jgi:hypothetical protein
MAWTPGLKFAFKETCSVLHLLTLNMKNGIAAKEN